MRARQQQRSLLTPSESLADGMARISKALSEKPSPGSTPDKLRVRDIYTMVAVFQPRKLDGRLAEDEAHIKALMDAIGDAGKPRELDPLIVWWGGLGWVLVDGFHRAEAYKRLKLSEHLVPVTVFSGTLSEAMAHAASCNSKDKLVMRKDDKLDTAWRLTLTSDLSKAKISNACKVSPRTVANMRAKANAIGGRINKFELAAKPWKLVNRLTVEELLGHKVKRMDGQELEDRLNKTAEQWAKRIVKTLGAQPVRNPEALARAIDIIEQRLPIMLMESEAWAGHLGSLTEALFDEGLDPLDEPGEDEG